MNPHKLSPEVIEDDKKYDVTLRPKVIDEYVGQTKIKENLNIFVEAARRRGEPLDHVLFYGPPGLGKTTLAYIISNELRVNIRATSGPALEHSGDLAALLTNLGERDVFFIDEIHRLNRIVEESLYPAMEDYELDIIIGQGPNARSVKYKLPRFTLVGATTRAGLLTSPMRDRFGVIFRLDFYSPEELRKIINRSAGILNIEVQGEGDLEIAKRARGTPRVANRLLRRVRDYAQVKGEGIITQEVSEQALKMLDVDRMGFDTMDQKILLTIIANYEGGPVGLETLTAAIGEEKETIEDVYEPFLIQGGFLDRTPRGRVATRLAYEHFEKISKTQGRLFK